jgi:hypothetical protein
VTVTAEIKRQAKKRWRSASPTHQRGLDTASWQREDSQKAQEPQETQAIWTSVVRVRVSVMLVNGCDNNVLKTDQWALS